MAFDRAHYLLIDDLGEEHSWPSSAIFREFEALRADYDPLAYAVRNLGFVLVIDRPGSLLLRLRPLLVSNRAIAALFYWLAERRPARSALSWFDDTWHDEVCGGPKQLYHRLTDILHSSARSVLTEPYLATRRSLDAVLDPPGHPFAPLLQTWLRGSREDLLAAPGTRVCGSARWWPSAIRPPVASASVIAAGRSSSMARSGAKGRPESGSASSPTAPTGPGSSRAAPPSTRRGLRGSSWSMPR